MAVWFGGDRGGVLFGLVFPQIRLGCLLSLVSRYVFSDETLKVLKR